MSTLSSVRSALTGNCKASKNSEAGGKTTKDDKPHGEIVQWNDQKTRQSTEQVEKQIQALEQQLQSFMARSHKAREFGKAKADLEGQLAGQEAQVQQPASDEPIRGILKGAGMTSQQDAKNGKLLSSPEEADKTQSTASTQAESDISAGRKDSLHKARPASAGRPRSGKGKQVRQVPGVGLYNDAMQKIKESSERSKQAQNQRTVDSLAECTFHPKLVSHAPMHAPVRKADPELGPGLRMYAEAMEAQRLRQEFIQQLAREEAESFERHAPRAKPLNRAVYGHVPKRDPSPKVYLRPDAAEYTFKPRLNQRRPASAPHSRIPLEPQSNEGPWDMLFLDRKGSGQAVSNSCDTTEASKQKARPATPTRSPHLPRLSTVHTPRPRKGTVWGPPPVDTCEEADRKQEDTLALQSNDDGRLTISQLGLTVPLDFDEFLNRQRHFLAAKAVQMKAEGVRQRIVEERPQSPKMSSGSRRFFSAPQIPQAEDVARRMRALWQMRRDAWMVDCTFQPILTARGRHARARTPDELSEGDRLRREYNREQKKMNRLLEEERQSPFRPIINRFPGVQASLEIRHPEIPTAECRQSQTRKQSLILAERLESQAQKELECTFTPKIMQKLPNFIVQMRQQRAHQASQSSSQATKLTH